MSGFNLMVKRLIKYLMYFVLLLLLFSLALIAYVLKTEAGTRWAISTGIEWADVEVTYDKLSGTISDGLVISNLRYHDQGIDINIKNINYESTWLWFNRHLRLHSANVDEVIIELKTTGDTAPSAPFDGYTMPLTIDIEQLNVNQLTWLTNSPTNTLDSGAEDSTGNQVKQIQLQAEVARQSAQIEKVFIMGPDYELNSSGAVKFGEGLQLDQSLRWSYDATNQNIVGSGQIKGGLQQLEIQQIFNITSDQITGDFQLQALVSEIMVNPVFDIELESNQSAVVIDSQEIDITQLKVEADGSIDDYRLTIQSVVAGSEVITTRASDESIDAKGLKLRYPTSEIKITAVGNDQEIITEKAQFITPDGRLDVSAKARWLPDLLVTGQIKLDQFNPQQINNTWPGLIDGNLNITVSSGTDKLTIESRENTLNGTFKGQEFELAGSAMYTSDTFNAEQLTLKLGANHLVVNGQIKPDDVMLTTDIDWRDLNLLSDRLNGLIRGKVLVSGDYQTPTVSAQLTAQQLYFDEHYIEQLDVDSSGQWNQSLTSILDIQQALIAGQNLNGVQINQSGWLDAHQFEINIDGQNFTTVLELKGKYQSENPQQTTWQATLAKHQLTVNTDKTIQLQQPIDIEFGDVIKIEEGCWQGVEAGTMCFAINDIDQSDQSYQGVLNVDSFSLIPLQVFLPEGLAIMGRLNGKADFEFRESHSKLESNLNLTDGAIVIRSQGGEIPIYESQIDDFKVDANTNNNNIEIDINTRLSDGSFVDLQGSVAKINEAMQIKAKFNGHFNNTKLISSLTEEVSDIEGQIMFDGSINGALGQPRIKLDLNQLEGFITLTRSGTVIEDLKLNIATENISVPVYTIDFSGNNLSAINQGRIESSGELSFNEKQQWNYQGKITGDNFMLLNLSTAKFKISPNLSIKANQESTAVKGSLVLDAGRVKVEQLPPSTIQNSSDLVIHRPDTTESNKYPVVLDIKASVKRPIELDVIGLKSGLTGSIQLIQNTNQPLSGKGVLQLTGGTYEIYGQELTINHGELIFTGPLDNPRINVKASRQSLSGDVIAGVELGGTVNNLRSTLYSEPSLSDIEKLSYIMTGRGIDNSGSLNGEQLQQAAIVMGLNQSSPVFKQIQSQFGIDVLTVREAASTADTVVEAGKKLSDKLYVSYNQGLFNRLGFWMLKYKINQFLNLETTQGDDQSVELVYTRKAEVPKEKTSQGSGHN